MAAVSRAVGKRDSRVKHGRDPARDDALAPVEKGQIEAKVEDAEEESPRSEGPRGKRWRVAIASPVRSGVARASRSVAAQTGGTASLPMRIARNVLPQMRQQPRKTR
jgi:hypothetical protein